MLYLGSGGMKGEKKLASSLHPSAGREKAWRAGYIKALWNKWEGARRKPGGKPFMPQKALIYPVDGRDVILVIRWINF